MAKKALIVGINYPGTSHELRGCVNDAELVYSVLTRRYSFSNIRKLLDNNATTQNILDGLEWLVADAVPGDTLYFHYSGHGSQMYDRNGDEVDGLDEIICPVDLDWDTKVVRDDDMKRIFDQVPNGVNLTVTLDCCNSGGGLDHNNQYQSLGAAERTVDGGRYLPQPDLTEDQAMQVEQYMGFKPRALQRNIDATGLMISGCQSHQTSADAYIGGRYIGACTHYLTETLKSANYNINYKDLVDSMNSQLVLAGFTQRPELNGPAVLFGKNFLQKYVETATTATDVDPHVEGIVDPVTEVIVEPAANDDGKKKKTGLIIAGLALTAAIIYFIAS